MTTRITSKLLLLLMACILLGCQTTDSKKSTKNALNRQDLLAGQGISSIAENLTYDKALTLARKAETSQEMDKALFYYIHCLEQKPNDAEILLRIGRIHDLDGRDDIAAKAYKEALSSDPGLLLAHQHLGIIEMERRQYSKAQEHLQKAILLDQKRLRTLGTKRQFGYHTLDDESPVDSYNASGVIEDMHRNFMLARIYYKLALTKQQTAIIMANLGYSFYLTGELTAAERYFRDAINLDNDYTKAWSNLGLVYARKGLYDRALTTLKQVMHEYEAYNDIGYFLMLEGRLEQAEYFFQSAIDSSPRYFSKAYANLEQVKLKKREKFLQQQGNNAGTIEPQGSADKILPLAENNAQR
ncbi:tetratricopeptide repeat protein [Thalassotalea aquiviva]|uniref:tetratricopeptide repeat protein n=1 Tax=Thalassotalea aquiviva TaxID=3242415 RepID=UPI003529ECDF